MAHNNEMKWLRCVFVIIWAMLLALSPLAVYAGNSAVKISVYAQGAFSNGLLDFTITYVTDTDLHFTWGYSGNATQIMIRGKYGGYPANIADNLTTPSDGYLVYTGNGTSADDTTMDFDQNAGPIYYRAWAFSPTEGWSTSFASGWKESAIVTLLALIGLAAVFSFLGARTSYYILKFLAGGAWVGVGLYWQTNPPSAITAGSATHVIIMILFFVFGIAYMFYPFWFSNGDSIGKVRAFWRSQEQEDELEQARHLSTRSERNDAYVRNLQNALRGRR